MLLHQNIVEIIPIDLCEPVLHVHLDYSSLKNYYTRVTMLVEFIYLPLTHIGAPKSLSGELVWSVNGSFVPDGAIRAACCKVRMGNMELH